MTPTKTCSACKETKPASAFYRRATGKTALRSHCKACALAACKKGRSEESQRVYEIVMHNYDPSFPLSPEAAAIIHSDEPPPPAFLALYEKRVRLAEQRKLRRNRVLRKLEAERPMRFARLPVNEVAA